MQEWRQSRGLKGDPILARERFYRSSVCYVDASRRDEKPRINRKNNKQLIIKNNEVLTKQ